MPPTMDLALAGMLKQVEALNAQMARLASELHEEHQEPQRNKSASEKQGMVEAAVHELQRLMIKPQLPEAAMAQGQCSVPTNACTEEVVSWRTVTTREKKSKY
uniref:Uncharacterized protein n=1 Tax=Anopheles atroparvus TaxID=41427 RepID=A0A182ITF4_ANOAO